MKYIHHDTNAIDDERLAELMIEFGYEGYGLFWAVLEKIGKQEKPIKTAVLKKQLKVGKRLEKCWSFMESIGLIYSSNGETFNKQLLNYAGKYQIKKEKTAERVSQFRERQQAAENVTHYERDCNAHQVKGIEVKRIEGEGEGFAHAPSASPKSSGKLEASDVAPLPESFAKSISERQMQKQGVFANDDNYQKMHASVYDHWGGWLPVNITGDKHYNNVNEVYRHYANRCEQLVIVSISKKQTSERQLPKADAKAVASKYG